MVHVTIQVVKEKLVLRVQRLFPVQLIHPQSLEDIMVYKREGQGPGLLPVELRREDEAAVDHL